MADANQEKRKSRVTKGRSNNNSRNNSRNNSPMATGMEQNNDDTWTCMVCKKPFSNQEDKLLECQRCKEHYCIKCLGKTEEEYEWMAKSDSMWFCTQCREKVERNIVIDKNIEDRCKEMAKAFEDRIKNLEDEMKQKCDEDKVKEIVREELKEQQHLQPTSAEGANNSDQINSIVSEINERRSRENNIIIHGIEEKLLETKENRIAYEKEVILNVSDVCEAALSEEDILRVNRIGKFSREKIEENQIQMGDNDETRKKKAKNSRPIHVVLIDPKLKRNFFKGGNKLKDSTSFQHARIANDLKQSERENERRMQQEAREREERSGEYRFKVRGPPWARKIVKTTK